ncbi:MAG: nitroreductase family deazaflavin-dependent oxidoreductase [Chloroflexota bacterium]
MDFRRLPVNVWRLLKLPRLWYALGLGPVIGWLVLLLTTTGRKTGLPRVTPLQYEEQDGVIYVASARGRQADWFRNILANPRVEIRVKARRFYGQAEPITDPARVADFLELRLKRHPRMMGAMLRGEGLVARPDRAQLEKFAAKIAVVAIRPYRE